ncbi:hypothetical protein L2E82_26257 [Cichorium intybus]|uniref:Uncharacterized protein n=1 Tax=Cichorium intybus TaxID=13427 RepID=A0ACB9E578_CICIN|nr:hypothetical protein L2E82_26257 [Cichorium intybus]
MHQRQQHYYSEINLSILPLPHEFFLFFFDVVRESQRPIGSLSRLIPPESHSTVAGHLRLSLRSHRRRQAVAEPLPVGITPQQQL